MPGNWIGQGKRLQSPLAPRLIFAVPTFSAAISEQERKEYGKPDKRDNSFVWKTFRQTSTSSFLSQMFFKRPENNNVGDDYDKTRK